MNDVYTLTLGVKAIVPQGPIDSDPPIPGWVAVEAEAEDSKFFFFF